MFQYKPGDLAKWCYPRLLHFHPRPLLFPFPQLISFGLILRVFDPKDIFEQSELIKYFVPFKDQPFLWFSLKEETSFLVFQDELFFGGMKMGVIE